QRCLNRVTLIGRGGREPENWGSSEHPCVIVPLATNTDWQKSGVFRPRLRDNVAARILKGDRLFVEGSLSYVKYTDQDKTFTPVSMNADEIMIAQNT
ncbi:unnamed protein product, partial [Candidula unifasciata]